MSSVRRESPRAERLRPSRPGWDGPDDAMASLLHWPLNFTDWSVESTEFGSTIRWQRRPAGPADPGAAPPMVRKWHGQWIWAAKTALAGPTAAQPYGSLDPSRFDARVLFRRTFLLESAPPEAAPPRLTAGSRHPLSAQ